MELVDGIRPFSVTLSVRHKGYQRRYYVGRVQVAYARPNGAEWVLDLIDATKRSNTYRFPSEAEMHAFLLEALIEPSRE